MPDKTPATIPAPHDFARRSIGIDASPEYAAMATRRLGLLALDTA